MDAVTLLQRANSDEALELFERAIRRREQIKLKAGTGMLRRRLEAKHRPELSKLLVALGEHVAKAATSVGFKPPVVKEAALAAGVAEAQRVLEAADLPKWAEANLGPWLDRLYAGAFSGTWSLAQPPGTAKTAVDAARQRVLQAGGKRLGLIDLSGDTKSALFRVMAWSREASAGQASPIEIARVIRDEVPAGRFVNAGAKYRAELIARTEIMNSTRVAQIETWRADPGVEVLVAIDGDFDEHCAARNGEEFTIDDAEAENNGDDVHPNCTLSFMPALRDV